MISVLVLTKNEEKDLPGCLDAVRWSDDIHVYDSFSNDGTVEIARRAGAVVTQRVFDDWSTHQNWGLRNLRFKHPWVLYVDADERVSPELRDAAGVAVRSPGRNVAFRCRRRDFWGQRWLRHVQASPFFIRLFQPERIRYERLVNPITVVDGDVGEISGYLDHYPFSKGLTHWLSRHNSYSSFEAQEICATEAASGARHSAILAEIMSRDFNVRRAAQKRLFYALPMRPLLKFALLYGVRGGFLDGQEGLQYAILQAIYEYSIVLKTREARALRHNR